MWFSRDKGILTAQPESTRTLPTAPGSLSSVSSPGSRASAHPLPRRATRIRQRLSKNAALLLMTLPGMLLLFIFAYLPMIGIVIAFKDYRAVDGIWGSRWIGFENFRYLFGTEDARRITFNTLFMNSIFIITILLGSLGIAFLLDEVRDNNKWLAKFYQSSLFFPYLLSYVVINYFVFAFLNTDNGVLNHFLGGFGISPIHWYESPQYWPVILTIVNLWKGAGFWSIVYLAGIIAINPEYYEAARIDGAGKWQQIRYITLPLLKPLIIINVLLSIGRIFYADFGLFFLVPRDSPQLYPTTQVIDTYVYHTLTALGDVGMSSAAGVYQAIIGFLLVLGANWIVRRTEPDKALF